MTEISGIGVLNIAPNRDILDYLRTFAEPSMKGRGMDYGGWELRSHPDLIGGLATVVGSSNALVPVLGVAAVVHKNVIVAVALGTDCLMFQLAAPPIGVEMEEPVTQLVDTRWHAVSAWQSHPNGLQRLKDILRDARDFASHA
jgi:hypothetical protein